MIVGGVKLEIPLLVAGAPHAVGVLLVGRRVPNVGLEIVKPRIDNLKIRGTDQQGSELKQDLMSASVLSSVGFLSIHPLG